MKKYYARICWNENNWHKPSGSAKDNPQTFFGQYGFGMEEWLFDPSAMIDGWQYGFLQPINKGYHKKVGSGFWLRLFSIPGGSVDKRRELFEIPNCEVISPSQAKEAFQVFKKNGRIKTMIRQVKAVNGDASPLTGPNKYFETFFNVRFRMEDVRKLKNKRPKLRADYYALYPIEGEPEVEIPITRPDEISDTEVRFEGSVIRVFVNRYERDPRARAACLRKWGTNCVVCDMSFQERYGPIGQNFIHVHHLTPLSEIKKSHRVDGAKDMRPVCPNCHAMLHQGPKPPDIKELRKYLKNASKQS